MSAEADTCGLGKEDAVGESADDGRRRRGSKNGYQDFLTLCKDADPDIPILKQAKAEYVKLY